MKIGVQDISECHPLVEEVKMPRTTPRIWIFTIIHLAAQHLSGFLLQIKFDHYYHILNTVVTKYGVHWLAFVKGPVIGSYASGTYIATYVTSQAGTILESFCRSTLFFILYWSVMYVIYKHLHYAHAYVYWLPESSFTAS